jgi:uncharacterized protein YlxW (UPF0749 family)
MTARHTSSRPAAPVRHYDDLLTQVLSSAVDQDYLAAARRAGAQRSRPAATKRFVAVVALFGILIGVSALKTIHDRPAQAAQRAQLVDEIHRRQAALNAMHSTLTSLQHNVTTEQTAVSAALATGAKLSGRLTSLRVDAGAVPVTGPGVSVTADDARDSGESPAGVIRDSDLQLLVNGLWEAGAEAIAINGQRLTSLSAIRYAGRAITVDYVSLTPPYVVDAIGDPDALPAALLQTQGGRAWQSLHDNLGIRFDVSTEQKLSLPADPHDHLTYARERGSR